MQVPYGYSPVIAANVDTLETTAPLIEKFLEASSKGWQDFVNDPQGCVMQVCTSIVLSVQCCAPEYADQCTLLGRSMPVLCHKLSWIVSVHHCMPKQCVCL